MQPGAADFTAGPEALHRAAAFDINGDAAHVVVSRRPHRDRIGRGIDPGHFAERADHRIAPRKILSGMGPRVEEDAMSLRTTPPDRARNDVARRELRARLVRHEALPG